MDRMFPLFSHKAWLLIAVISAVLASVSGSVLLYKFDYAFKDQIGRAFDSVELFMRDTVRLSFKNKKIAGAPDAAFVAPKGLLDQKMVFNWLDDKQDASLQSEEFRREAQAPLRILDPSWTPAFSGMQVDQESR